MKFLINGKKGKTTITTYETDDIFIYARTHHTFKHTYAYIITERGKKKTPTYIYVLITILSSETTTHRDTV